MKQNLPDHIGVLGIGETGTASAQFFIDQGKKVTLYHKEATTPATEQITQLEAQGAIFVPQFTEPVTSLALLHQMILMSPGVMTSIAIREAIRSGGTALENDLTVFLEGRTEPTAAITGSNGKSTVTTLVAAMLNASGHEAHACGNLGKSPLALCFDSGAIPVIEVSNAQLEIFQPIHRVSVALLNNLSPNHLNRYSFEGDGSKESALSAYIDTKFRLLQNSDVSIINHDDELIRENVAARFPGFKESAVRFSLRQELGEGAFLDASKNNLLLKRHGELHMLCQVNDLLIGGQHNLANALAASLVAFEMGATIEGIREGLRTFRGLRHRIEPVGRVNGTRFINDSKSTSPAATIEALRTVKNPLVLILGGDAKGVDFEPEELRANIGHVAMVIQLPGRSSDQLTAPFHRLSIPVEKAASMEAAVERALRVKDADVVLLSPAAGSHPEYRNFEQRGDIYTEAVKALAK